MDQIAQFIPISTILPLPARELLVAAAGRGPIALDSAVARVKMMCPQFFKPEQPTEKE